MHKFVIMAFVVLVLASSLVFMQNRAESIASSVLAEPQAKCEKGFTFVQFKGEEGWFQTTKKCDMRATPPKLDTTHASKKLTQPQVDALLRSYLAGNPKSVDINVCCCQPGWQVYDNSISKCSNGEVINR